MCKVAYCAFGLICLSGLTASWEEMLAYWHLKRGAKAVYNEIHAVITCWRCFINSTYEALTKSKVGSSLAIRIVPCACVFFQKALTEWVSKGHGVMRKLCLNILGSLYPAVNYWWWEVKKRLDLTNRPWSLCFSAALSAVCPSVIATCDMLGCWLYKCQRMLGKQVQLWYSNLISLI